MPQEFKSNERMLAVSEITLEPMDSTNTTMDVSTGKELQSALTGDRRKIKEEVLAHKFSPQALKAMELLSKNSANQK